MTSAAARQPVWRIALGLAWILAIGVTALGHATALRNTLTVAVSLATLCVYLRDWRALPCKAAVAALVAWSAASLLWSAAPAVTTGKLRTDLLIPLLAGAAAYCFTRDGRGLRAVIGGLILGIVALAVLSVFAYLPPNLLPAKWALEISAGIVRPLPHWYPGPGDASMFAILAIAPLAMTFVAARDDPAARRLRVGVAVVGLLLVFVLVTTNNRNAVLVAPLVIALQWLLGRRGASSVGRDAARSTGRWRRVAVGCAAALVALAALAAVLEFGARERLEYLHRSMPDDSAAIDLMATDTRPVIWRYYFARGLEHPWIGIGFGRTVPGIGWQTQSDRQLAAIEPNAYIHAHDLPLNWWLQLGLVGVVLLSAVIASLVAAARRLAVEAGAMRRASLLKHALIATLVATLLRNLTDDFMVYGMATAFCVVVGALLGESSRLARAWSIAAVDHGAPPSADAGAAYFAPKPVSTVVTVRMPITRSSANDRCLT